MVICFEINYLIFLTDVTVNYLLSKTTSSFEPTAALLHGPSIIAFRHLWSDQDFTLLNPGANRVSLLLENLRMEEEKHIRGRVLSP